MNPNKIIGVFAVAIAPVVIASNLAIKAKAKISDKIDNAKFQQNRR